MCSSQNRFYVTDVAGANTCNPSNLSSNVDLFRLWQICQTFVLPSGDLILERLLLQVGLQFEGNTDPSEIIPILPRPELRENELERLFIRQGVLKTNDGRSAIADRLVPVAESSDNGSRPRDRNRRFYVAAFWLIDPVERDRRLKKVQSS